MKNLVQFIFIIMLTLAITSCSEDDFDPSIFDTSGTKILNSTDQYLYDTYQIPYNVEAIYRWRESETDMSFNLIPPYLEKVQPLMHVIDTTYVEPYDLIAGSSFLKKYIPKQFLLIGSSGINAASGTEVLGTAEGGVKILLYKVNQFDRNLPETYDDILHTIHHEFAHILHQNKLYDKSYKDITPSGYTATWYNFTDAQANAKGFITAYAMASADEDFAEMFSMMLLNGKEKWDNMVNAMVPGRDSIRSKENKIVTYCSEKWKIDFYELQKVVYSRIAALHPSGIVSPAPAVGLRATTSCGCHHYSTYAPPSKGTNNPTYEIYKQALEEIISNNDFNSNITE